MEKENFNSLERGNLNAGVHVALHVLQQGTIQNRLKEDFVVSERGRIFIAQLGKVCDGRKSGGQVIDHVLECLVLVAPSIAIAHVADRASARL